MNALDHVVTHKRLGGHFLDHVLRAVALDLLLVRNRDLDREVFDRRRLVHVAVPNQIGERRIVNSQRELDLRCDLTPREFGDGRAGKVDRGSREPARILRPGKPVERASVAVHLVRLDSHNACAGRSRGAVDHHDVAGRCRAANRRQSVGRPRRIGYAIHERHLESAARRSPD